MKVQIYGWSAVREGDYQGRHWKNRQMYIERMDNVPDDITGSLVETIKIPYDLDLTGLNVGDYANVYYNRYGRVESVIKAV